MPSTFIISTGSVKDARTYFLRDTITICIMYIHVVCHNIGVKIPQDIIFNIAPVAGPQILLICFFYQLELRGHFSYKTIFIVIIHCIDRAVKIQSPYCVPFSCFRTFFGESFEHGVVLFSQSCDLRTCCLVHKIPGVKGCPVIVSCPVGRNILYFFCSVCLRHINRPFLSGHDKLIHLVCRPVKCFLQVLVRGCHCNFFLFFRSGNFPGFFCLVASPNRKFCLFAF